MKRTDSRKRKGYLAAAIAVIFLICTACGAKNFSADAESAIDAGISYEQGSIQETDTETGTPAVAETVPETEEQTRQAAQTETETRTDELTRAENNEPDEKPQAAQTETETVMEAQETAALTYDFRKAQYLTEHFQKHGAEFPYATEAEYLTGANRVISHPDSLHKLEAEDGDDVYYLESTNEFVIVSTDGYIRTYFKPNSGIDYYNRQ